MKLSQPYLVHPSRDLASLVGCQLDPDIVSDEEKPCASGKKPLHCVIDGRHVESPRVPHRLAKRSRGTHQSLAVFLTTKCGIHCDVFENQCAAFGREVGLAYAEVVATGVPNDLRSEFDEWKLGRVHTDLDGRELPIHSERIKYPEAAERDYPAAGTNAILGSHHQRDRDCESQDDRRRRGRDQPRTSPMFLSAVGWGHIFRGPLKYLRQSSLSGRTLRPPLHVMGRVRVDVVEDFVVGSHECLRPL
ncbi:hypothetical protein BMS3Bbin02_01863 [bacterium BMS3Bbin02]|nr:hypothetical protein BMS3Bbin02_01863 [bacterium BMS3Bbin02]